MSLAVTLEPHQKQTYADNVKMVAQQTKSKYRDTVTELPASGEAMSAADLVGSVEAQEDNGIDRRNIENNPKLARRWLVFPNRIRSGQYIDREDKMKRAMDPTSIYVRTHTLAVQRAWGDKILGIRYVSKGVFEARDGGVLGAAVDGKGPGSAKVSLPSECFTPSGNTGLTVDKAIDATEALHLRDFGLEDDDQKFCSIGPKQVSDLLRIASATGQNLNQFEIQQLKSGKPTEIMGLIWIVTNRGIYDANGDRMCPIWTKNNILAGVWEDINGMLDVDTHADWTPYARVQAYVDVVRAEDEGVQVMLCKET